MSLSLNIASQKVAAYRFFRYGYLFVLAAFVYFSSSCASAFPLLEVSEEKLTQSFAEKDIVVKKSLSSYPTTNRNSQTAFINKKAIALGETRYPVEVDLKTLKTIGPFLFEKEWKIAAHFAGELLFIPAPHALVEDEGIALSIVYNQEKNDSFLLILDAMSWEEIARIQAPFPIPFGLHSNFAEN